MTIVSGEVVKVDEHTVDVQIASKTPSPSVYERIQTVAIPNGKTPQDYPVGSIVRLEVTESVGTRPSVRIL